VPIGSAVGTLSFTVTDGGYSNTIDYQQLLASTPKSPGEVISFLNNLRPNTSAYVRVWRADPAFQVQGLDLPLPPASIGLILSRAQVAQGATLFPRSSKLDELRIDTGDTVVTGSKSVSVEVKE